MMELPVLSPELTKGERTTFARKPANPPRRNFKTENKKYTAITPDIIKLICVI
jgi:hypothetical protein